MKAQPDYEVYLLRDCETCGASVVVSVDAITQPIRCAACPQPERCGWCKGTGFNAGHEQLGVCGWCDGRKYKWKPDYDGRGGNGEHRTCGPIRAWCHDCTEWCYDTDPCRCCWAMVKAGPALATPDDFPNVRLALAHAASLVVAAKVVIQYHDGDYGADEMDAAVQQLSEAVARFASPIEKGGTS